MLSLSSVHICQVPKSATCRTFVQQVRVKKTRTADGKKLILARNLFFFLCPFSSLSGFSKKSFQAKEAMSVVLVSSASASATHTKSNSIKIPFLSPPSRVSISPQRWKLLDIPLRVAAPPSSVPTSDPAEESRFEDEYGGEKEEEGSEFKWRDHWYPVSLVEDLDPNSPTRFQLLGRDLVLWFDRNDQKWAAFDDLCPHRLAPLSVNLSLYFLKHK